MVKHPVKLLIFEDLRWCLLMCLAVLLIARGLPTLHKGSSEPGGMILLAAKSWLEMDLVWEEEGQFGQGIYSIPGKAAQIPSTMVIEATPGEDNLVDPHLAVFTFRAMDLNRIDFNTLRVLKGVGPKMALAIISYRQKRGPFYTIEDLLEVKGVGPAKFKVLSHSLTVKAGR